MSLRHSGHHDESMSKFKIIKIIRSENTHHRGKYDCMTDLFGLDFTKQVKLLFIQHKQSSYIQTKQTGQVYSDTSP